MAIPKKIHYCWFGGKEIPELFKNYIKTWSQLNPDYEIIRWDETNFDVDCCKYVRDAYDNQKWAFVSDYARFRAIYSDGGIYLDTDIEMLKTLDPFLEDGAFFGFGKTGLTVPVFGAEAGHPCIKDILSEYDSREFVMDDGSFDMSPIENTVQKVLVDKYGLVMNGTTQVLRERISVYENKYFFSWDYRTGIITVNPLLVLIHHGEGSWLSDVEKERLIYRRKASAIFGERMGCKIAKVAFAVHRFGVLGCCRKVLNVWKNKK